MALTKREIEIVQLIADEYTSEEIGKTLQISLATVESHRRNIFRKEGIASVVGLIKKGIVEGWIINNI